MVTYLGSVIAFLVAGFLADHVFDPLLEVNGLLAGTAGYIIGVGEGRGIALMFVISGAMISVISLFIWQNNKIKGLEDTAM